MFRIEQQTLIPGLRFYVEQKTNREAFKSIRYNHSLNESRVGGWSTWSVRVRKIPKSLGAMCKSQVLGRLCGTRLSLLHLRDAVKNISYSRPPLAIERV